MGPACAVEPVIVTNANAENAIVEAIATFCERSKSQFSGAVNHTT